MSDHERVLHGLKAELEGVCDLIAQAHAQLASARESRPSAESELRMLWERRDTLVGRIGAVVAEQILSGQHVVLSAAANSSEATESGEATAPAAAIVEPVVRVTRRRAVMPSAPAEPAFDRGRLAEFMSELGSPEPARSVDAFLETYERLRYVATHCNRWLDVPPKAQRHLVGAVVAWLRDLQESNDDFGRPLREPQLVGLISRMSHWSREHRPGWVNGLARGATPDGGSWRQDTLYHLEALQGLLTPARASSVDPLERLRHALDNRDPGYLDQLDEAIDAGLSPSDPALVELFVSRPELIAGTRHTGLLRRVYERLEIDAPRAEGADTMEFVPLDWAWLGYTRGHHALLLGGEPSAPTAAGLKDAFEFAKVTWDPAGDAREGSILRRIASGAVDLVLVDARHVSEALEQAIDDACAEADLVMAVCPDGFGVRSVRLAIEDELEPFEEGDLFIEEQPRA